MQLAIHFHQQTIKFDNTQIRDRNVLPLGICCVVYTRQQFLPQLSLIVIKSLYVYIMCSCQLLYNEIVKFGPQYLFAAPPLPPPQREITISNGHVMC